MIGLSILQWCIPILWEERLGLLTRYGLQMFILKMRYDRNDCKFICRDWSIDWKWSSLKYKRICPGQPDSPRFALRHAFIYFLLISQSGEVTYHYRMRTSAICEAIIWVGKSLLLRSFILGGLEKVSSWSSGYLQSVVQLIWPFIVYSFCGTPWGLSLINITCTYENFIYSTVS